MHHFAMKRGEMVCEGVPLGRIADAVGTPVYVYSHATLSHHYGVFDRVFSGTPHLICYSMKANPNGSIIRTFTNLGSGVDIVSGGELSRALAAGTPPSKIVYSGVGKMEWEIEEALRRGILMFNVESRQELETIDAIARTMRGGGDAGRGRGRRGARPPGPPRRGNPPVRGGIFFSLPGRWRCGGGSSGRRP